jgi:hypothetical protein
VFEAVAVLKKIERDLAEACLQTDRAAQGELNGS